MVPQKVLIAYLERMVFSPALNHPKSDKTIKSKVVITQIRIGHQVSPEKVDEFFQHALTSERGEDTYKKMKAIGLTTFEDVATGFMRLCGHADDGSQPVRIYYTGAGSGRCFLKLQGCAGEGMGSVRTEPDRMSKPVCAPCNQKMLDDGAWYCKED